MSMLAGHVQRERSCTSWIHAIGSQRGDRRGSPISVVILYGCQEHTLSSPVDCYFLLPYIKKKKIIVKFYNLVSTDVKLNHRALEVIVCLFFLASMTFLSEGEGKEEKNSIYFTYLFKEAVNLLDEIVPLYFSLEASRNEQPSTATLALSCCHFLQPRICEIPSPSLTKISAQILQYKALSKAYSVDHVNCQSLLFCIKLKFFLSL